MNFPEVKTLLATLVLPPAGPLLLALLGILLAARRRRGGLVLAGASVFALTVLSVNAVAIQVHALLLPAEPPLRLEQMRGVQAIVVLGGGVLPEAPEYGAAQLNGATLSRLRYGAWLHRKTGVPLAVAGGVGWNANTSNPVPEGTIARRIAKEDFGVEARWIEDESRDTAENAQRMAEILLPQGVRRIALVTEAYHMQRAVGHFRARGFQVTPAPTELPGVREATIIEWLPSVHGLATSRAAIREWIGLRVVPPPR